MVSFNFQLMFAPRIKAGTKKHTIRATKRCSVGDSMHMFTGLRTPFCNRIGEAPCIVVYEVEITQENVVVLPKKACTAGYYLSEDGKPEFAKMGGFDSWEEMVSFYEKHHGLPWRGWLHGWGALVEESPSAEAA